MVLRVEMSQFVEIGEHVIAIGLADSTYCTRLERPGTACLTSVHRAGHASRCGNDIVNDTYRTAAGLSEHRCFSRVVSACH